jgi:PEP-CTERM motif
MKYLRNIVPTVMALVGLSLQAHAATIVNDTWADGNRTSTGPDGAGYDTAWYGTGGSASSFDVVAPGDLRGVVDPGSSSSWTTFITPEASPMTLGSVGDFFTITWVFTPTGVDTTGNTSQNFRLAITDTPGADRISSDAAPTDSTYTGYAMFMNMATTLSRSTPFQLKARSLLTTGNLLSSSGNWGTSLGNDGTTGDTGYADGVEYTFTFTATRNASDGLDLLAQMSGGSLGNDGTLQVALTDTAPTTFTFDTFAIRPSSGDGSAQQFDTSLFQVDYTAAAVPEPSTIPLAGLAAFGLIAGRRRMRR